jgi:ATP-binding cassette subfamily B protein/ATP-binding cassette subfamily C protein
MNLPLQRYWQLLVRYLAPQRRKVALLAGLIFGGIALQLINPQIIRYFIDTAISGSYERNLVGAAITYLVTSLLLQATGVAATYVGEDIGWRTTNNLRADLARHCLRLDMSFHNDHKPGEMIERIDGDVADIGIFFAQFVIRILGNLLLLMGVLLVLLAEDWRISLALAIYTILSLAAIIYLRQIATPHWKAARQASADLSGFLEEQLSGTEDIRASGAVSYVMRNLFKYHRQLLEKQLKAGSMSILLIMTWLSLYTLSQIITLYLGYTLYQAGLLSVGSVFMIINYTDIIFRPLREITNEIQNLQKAAASIERVESLYSLESQIKDQGQAAPDLPAGSLAVEFDGVTFGYSEETPVLNRVSFHLEPGQVLGLLGRTGSGKTTLTRLLFRLYDPGQGSIRLGANGGGPGAMVDIRQTGLDNLRQAIGMVTQEVQLFRATVRDNLTFFDKTIPNEQILEVIETLGLSAWFQGLPEGLDTELQSSGTNLSAGEAQLLAFTRVFLRNPGLVILDEASSRLDPATEQLIERAVDRLLAGRTGIIVAHRLSTVHRADQIMIIEAGHIREFGRYSDLVHDPTSRFYELLQTGMEEVLV